MRLIKALPFIVIFILLAWYSQHTLQPKQERLNPPYLNDQIRVGVPKDVGMNSILLQSILDSIEYDLHRDLNSILISRNGILIFEAYFKRDGRKTLHDIRSAGKSFTSTLTGIALHQGALKNIDNKVFEFFPEYRLLKNPDPRKAKITIRHLLEMRSGFDADDDIPSTPGNENKMLRSQDWISYALNVKMADEPGKSWRYAGMNTMLLGGVIQRTTGIELSKYLEKKLLKPIGIKEYRWGKSPSGHASGQGFLYLRPRDILKFGQLFLQKGKWNGQQVVPESWIKEATTIRTRFQSGNSSGYGYQWWIGNETLGSRFYNFYFASGNGGQKIYVIPNADMVVVITSSAYNKGRRGHERSRQILTSILSSIL